MKRGMKKRLLISIFLILTLNILSAEHIVRTSDGTNSYSINVSTNFRYTLLINNTDIGQNASISQVNITIPANISYISNSAGTNVQDYHFSDSGNLLSWANFSHYIINSTDSKSFWFNANSSIPGNYTLIIITSNQTGSISSTILINILQVTNPTSCTENWNCTNWTICSNNSQTKICQDTNNCNTTINKPVLNQTCNSTVITCSQEWSCSNWTACVGEIQVRACIDKKNCGNETGKPIESQNCIPPAPPCMPNWNCTGWLPEKCPKNKTQTKICTDLNHCGKEENKPLLIQSCEYKRNNFLIYLLSGMLILVIGGLIFFIFYKLNKKKEVPNYVYSNYGDQQDKSLGYYP